MKLRSAAIVVLSCVLFYISYLFSGCQYTIDGNPDVDLTEVHVSPIAAVVATNGRLVLTASVLGFSNTASVTWSVDGTGSNGTITANGSTAVFLAPPILTSLHQVATITVTSDENANRSVVCKITIIRTSDTAFNVSPLIDSMLTSSAQTNSAQQFFIDTITDQSPIPALRWEIVSGLGSIDNSGLFTAPMSIPSDGSKTVIRAVSVTDSTVFSQSTITLFNFSDSILCFTRDILPVLSANCGMGGCHDDVSRKGGYDFNTFSGAIGSVRAGNARSSRLFTAITQFEVNSRMPPAPAPALGQAQVLKIGEWIDEGATDCQ